MGNIAFSKKVDIPKYFKHPHDFSHHDSRAAVIPKSHSLKFQVLDEA